MSSNGTSQFDQIAAEEERWLIARCLRGDGAAWDELFDMHYGPAARFVFQLGFELTCQDVEEVCQEVFLSVIRNLSGFEGKSRLQTWIFRIAANKARDFCQKQGAAKRGGGRAAVPIHPVDRDVGPSVDPPSPAPDPSGRLIQSEHMELIGHALRQLGDYEREIIEMRYFAQLSYKEIGASLNLNDKTVSSRLSRAVARLKVRVQAMTRPPACREMLAMPSSASGDQRAAL